MPSDPVRKAGKCAFASRDIRKCRIMCEYEGELLTVEEAKVCKESYKRGRKSLHPYGFEECRSPDCVSVIISVYISVF